MVKSFGMTPPNPSKSQSKSSSSASPAPDRVDTPDALDVNAVLAAASTIDREKLELAARKKLHMEDCPVSRNGDCACPCNLFNMPPPLEAVKFGDVQMVRVDDGHTVDAERPDPSSSSAPPMKYKKFIEPKWVCTTCGFAQRAAAMQSHQCDEALLVWRLKPVPLALLVPEEQRFSGGFRVTLHRLADGRYVLSELVMRDGKVVADSPVMKESFYPSVEGQFLTMAARNFILPSPPAQADTK